MKKIIVAIMLFSVFPVSAFAAIDSLNGLTSAIQSLISPGSNATNTMHMDIVQVGTDKHRFRWDGTPWRADQGGTGSLATPSFGELLMGNGLGGYDLVATSSLRIAAGPIEGAGFIQFGDNGNFGASKNLFWNSGYLVLGEQGEGSAGIIFNTVVPGGDVVLDYNGERKFGLYSSTNADPLDPFTFEFSFLGGEVFGFQPMKMLVSTGSTLATLDFSNVTLPNAMFIVPNQSGTFGILEASQQWTGTNTFSSLSGTTTVNFGTLDDADSRACFNTKNTGGDDISFYFVGTSMVVEDEPCK